VAGLATATVIVARGSTPGPVPPSTTGGGDRASAQLLPGETTWGNGTPSYIFGTNDTLNYGSPNVDTLPSVQSYLKQGGLTLDRIWAYDDGTYGTTATIEQKVTAGQNAGMTCLFMLGETEQLSWLESTVQLTEPMGCHLFEFGNEPDNSGSPANGKISTYTNQWNADIPQLKALSVCSAVNACLFGGPAVMGPTSSDGSQGSYPSDLAYFLGHTATTTRADFISYHDYPCYGYTAQSACLTHTTQAFAQDQSEVLAWEQTYYENTVPTGISEYNFDPGSSTLSSWSGDSKFMFDWTQVAIQAFVANHFSFATQFTSMNYSGYGDLDMFSDSAPYGPKAQFYGIVSEVEKYGGSSTLAIPNPLP
jgi:hypothetical protein